MLTRIPIAFVAGLASVAFPCVLPLVPGYLSIVSAAESARLGEPGSVRRLLAGSMPFFAGFTTVFVALGAGAAALAELVGPQAQAQVAGLVLVVFGFAFLGLLPLPGAAAGTGLLARARSRGSGLLLGAAFAVCAAPCIGGVLAGILVLAGDTGTVARGAVLLFFYSAGIAAAFLLLGLAFARAIGAFRWVRDRYRVIQAVGGVMLLALGLLLFFDRYWLLQVVFARALRAVGIDSI
jgi:cytochrome c-type biogenesis protein